MLFTRVAPCIKSKGLPIGGPLFSKKLMLFTRVALRTKSKWLPIGGPLLSKKTYAFYMCSIAYKKQETPDRRPLIQQKKSILFTRVAPRIKSKGLPIDAPHIIYYFQHALHHVHKARGSVGMCTRFIILLIKFPKVFAAHLVSSSLCIIQTISHQILIGGSIYFSYTTVINIREVRGIYLYLSESNSSSM
jgi:hypothetical protein